MLPTPRVSSPLPSPRLAVTSSVATVVPQAKAMALPHQEAAPAQLAPLVPPRRSAPQPLSTLLIPGLCADMSTFLTETECESLAASDSGVSQNDVVWKLRCENLGVRSERGVDGLLRPRVPAGWPLLPELQNLMAPTYHQYLAAIRRIVDAYAGQPHTAYEWLTLLKQMQVIGVLGAVSAVDLSHLSEDDDLVRLVRNFPQITFQGMDPERLSNLESEIDECVRQATERLSSRELTSDEIGESVLARYAFPVVFNGDTTNIVDSVDAEILRHAELPEDARQMLAAARVFALLAADRAAEALEATEAMHRMNSEEIVRLSCAAA